MFKCWLSLEAVNCVSEKKNKEEIKNSERVSVPKYENTYEGKRKTIDSGMLNIRSTGGTDYDKFGWSLSFSLK